MELLCNVYYTKNFKAPDWYIEAVENEYMERRDLAIVLLNNRYETWNKEFDKLYPGLDGTTKEYADFISEKTQTVLDIVNKRLCQTNYILLKASNDPDMAGDIYCVLRQNEKAEMHMSIKVLNEYYN